MINTVHINRAYAPYLRNYSNGMEIYYGGAGSGKSYFIAQKIALKCLTLKRKVLVIRKTLTSQKDSCWELFLSVLETLQASYVQLKTDYKIVLPNGSELLFKGLDDPERVKSIVGITDLWCEECTELSEEDFDQLLLRIRADVDDMQVFCSFNPISKANWVYKRWFVDNKDDAVIIKTTYLDNLKHLKQDYVDRLENMININPTYYRIYALGEFCSLDKLVYSNWEEREFNYSDIDGELIVGLDYGFTNDPTALVASIVDGENIYIFREWVEVGKTNPEIANAIISLGFSKSFIIADSAEPKSVEEIRRLGIQRIRESKKGADSIIHGIQSLQQYRLIVHPSCTNVITELQNYSWQKDKKSGEYINKPVDMFNHCMDALRYSLQALDKHRLRTMSKGALGL